MIEEMSQLKLQSSESLDLKIKRLLGCNNCFYGKENASCVCNHPKGLRLSFGSIHCANQTKGELPCMMK